MNVNDFQAFLKKPKLYEKGTAMMWTDPYIQTLLLKTHLDQNTDAASRKEESINRTVEWIFSSITQYEVSVLDLGCGPGLYSEKMAERGHKVTGIDISNYALDYAKKSAKAKNLSIDYLQGNYLEVDFAKPYDLIDIIYCDFGVLTKLEQELLLKRIFLALAPGGVFVMDAFNMNLEDTLKPHRDFESQPSGFWRNHPYICLSETFLYPESNAF